MADLSPGDFLYQSDQELFLVLVAEDDNSYQFAVHGWREIGKDRIDEYISDSRSKVHRQNEVEKIVGEQGDENTQQQLNKLKQLFAVYESNDISDDGPHTHFQLKE